MQFLYRDGELFHFMNTESDEQIHLSLEVLGDDASYLLPEAIISVEFYETEPGGSHLPLTVDLRGTDPGPGAGGNVVRRCARPATT